jgi:glutamate--cysteine ligase
MLPIAFEDGFGFEKFTDYAMNAMPMLGLYKGDVFFDARGGKFSEFMEGKLSVAPGQKATTADWANHLNTIYPEVRLRRGLLEMRGADVGPQEMIKAMPAFWGGLLYDRQSLEAAYEMTRDWTQGDREYLRTKAPTTGLQTQFLGTTIQDMAKDVIALAEAGLKRRNILDTKGRDESMYLEPLKEIAESGRNWAQRLIERFEGPWKGDISHVFNEMNYANEPSVLKPAPALAAAPATVVPIRKMST